MKSLPRFLLGSVLSAGFAACQTFGSSDSDGGVEPSSDAQADTLVTIPAEAGALDASSPDADPPVDGGRSWKAFFVTSNKITGALAGAGAAGDSVPFGKADVLCNSEAASAGLLGQFLALVRSDVNFNLTERARASSGPRYLPKAGGMRGPIIVPDIAVPTALALTIAPNVYASGMAAPPETRVWTGGSSASSAFCSGVAPWTSEIASASGTVGDPSKTDGQVGDVGNVACNQAHSLYCVEK